MAILVFAGMTSVRGCPSWILRNILVDQEHFPVSYLEVFKARLEGAVSNLVSREVSLPTAGWGGWK